MIRVCFPSIRAVARPSQPVEPHGAHAIMSLNKGFLGLATIVSCAALAACSDDDKPAGATQESAAKLDVTWHEHIAPLIIEKCTACHNKEGIAPFSLDNYSDASAVASQVAQAVMSGQMPPYLAQDTD